jgi:hypothetical protein
MTNLGYSLTTERVQRRLAAVLAADVAGYKGEGSMTLNDLVALIFNLNHLLDYEFAKGVTLEEIEQHIEDGDILQWLDHRFEGHVDMSMYLTTDRPAAKQITKGLQDLLGGYRGSERPKWGVKNNGICLLIAWTAEMIQQRDWSDSEFRD